MKRQNVLAEPTWQEEFERLYITTYQAVYRHGKLIINQEEKVKELLILTYMEAYQRQEQLQKEKTPVEWLIKRADFWAETKLEASKEMLEASYAEEKMQSREAKKENRSHLDEASILLEIEDRLGLVDVQEEGKEKSIALLSFQGIFSLVLFAIAVIVLMIGLRKVKYQFDLVSDPFYETFTAVSDQVQESNSADENRIQLGNKVVYLSDIGQVLYSLPLEETDLAGTQENNPEIQKMDGWTYYLPCPERKDSQLSHVQPILYHTLYRMRNDGKEMEIVGEEVDDYILWKDAIYVNQYGRIQRISTDEFFEKMQPGYYAEVMDHELYIYDSLGRTLNTEADGSLPFGDRILEMSSNRVLDVKEGQRVKGDAFYYLKEMEDGSGKAIYCSINGKETLFEKQGNTIDSFCIVGDWIYYSAYMRRGGSGAHYSEVFRKSITDLEKDKKAESLREEFTGRIRQLYYSEEARQIYGNYIPRNWESNRGVIAVLSLSGQLSYLDDEAYRKGVETTGNDFLEFIMMQDGQVYCYWKDCYWKKGEDPVVKWRKVLVLSDHNRKVVGD